MLRTLRQTISGSTGPSSGRIAERSRSRGSLAQRARQLAGTWPHTEYVALTTVLAIAACLNLLRLWREGYANSYYAAAVKSMLGSWHNFFFVSFDPGGFVTIDKPPLGFWIQTASAKLFGFHGWSILLPQALAGVASVAVLFFVVRRVFGSAAGLLAALALALTPISVATNRNNTIDSLLVLTVLLATWAVLKATEAGRLRWLLVGMALLGAGFNIKTLEAFLVLPALVLVYLLAAPLGWRRRMVHLAAAGAVLAVVSLSWMTIVDLTPASQRPYVGSSQHNSELELALGYNGLQRLLGHGAAAPKAATTQQTAPGATQPDASSTSGTGSLPVGTQAADNAAAGPGGPGGNGGPGGLGENGPVGVFRLLDTQLGGQIGWLIPGAVLGLIAAWQTGISRFRRGADRRHQSLIVWGVWFLTCAVFFSKALFFHRYYLSMLAPAVAALFGIGAVALWQAYRQRGPRGWLLPLALLLMAAGQVYILRSYSGWNVWLTPIVVAPCAAAALVLTLARLPGRSTHANQQTPAGTARRWHLPAGPKLPVWALAGVTGLALLALLAAPAVWAGDTVRNNAAAGGIPSAGPAVAGADGFGGPPPGVVRTLRDSSAQSVAVPADATSGRAAPAGAGVADGGQAALPADGAGFGGPPSVNNGGLGGPPSGNSGGLGGPPTGDDGGFNGPPPGGPGGPGGGISKQVEQFLVTNQGSAKYLVAVSGAGEAEQLILDTGKPVMAMGGFSGSDPILTARAFAALVKQGVVRFVQLGGMGRGGQDGLSTWVQSSCAVVSVSEVQSSTPAAPAASAATRASNQQLYDCATAP